MAESIGLRIQDPQFWDANDLRQEVDRIFDICHSCRLCFKFCGSFQTLFEMIDGKTDALRQAYLAEHPEVAVAAAQRRKDAGDTGEPQPVEHGEPEVGVTYGDELPELAIHTKDLSKEEIDRVVDLCFQCKLCYPNCPYTPPHDFAIDFPRLLLRWKAHRVRGQGLSLKTRTLRDTVLIGKSGSAVPTLTNWALRSPLNRRVMESTVGIHRDKLMPRYHSETFPAWWRKRTANVETAQAPRGGIEARVPLKVVLFSTCVLDFNDPAAARAAVQVLEHNGIEVAWPEGQVCCGMPYLDEGDVDTAAGKARANHAVLAPWVERGYAVLVPSPSCSLMVREEYPQLVDTTEMQRLAEHTHDLNEYLYRFAREGRLKRDFQRRFDAIRYHVPCHIRVQNIGIRGRDLLKLVADNVEAVQECSGHDGTWSMDLDHFEESLHWGRKAFEAMRQNVGEPCALACSDCRLASLHLQQGAGVESVHPIVVLAHAYGFDAEVPIASKPAT
jgi:Fe-S oxidoreductase